MYKTDITILVDESSSMSDARSKTLSAIKEFIEGQKKVDGECNVSVISFARPDRRYNIFYPSSNEESRYTRKVLVSGNINNIEFTGSDYNPNGWTPLYDAVCDTVDETGRRLASMKKEARPDKVLFLILTDGMENASSKTVADVKSRIQHQETVYSWNFTYLGADFNTDDVTKTCGLGFDRSYKYDKKDTEKAWRGINATVSSYRLSSNHKVDNFAATTEANAN